MSDYLLKKKRVKQCDKKIEELNDQINQLTEKYISSEGIYGDPSILLDINNLKSKRNEFLKMKRSIGPVLNNRDVEKIDNSSVSINEVIFDMSSASYKISYNKNGRSFCEPISIYRDDMKKNSKVVKEIIDKYGSYTLQNIDVNLYSALSKFDKKMNSNFAEDFARNGNAYPIEYQLDGFYKKNSKLNIFDKIKIRNMANRNENSSHKLSKILPIAIGMAIFAGSVFGISHQNDDNINDKKFSSRVMTDDDFMNMSNSARSTKSSVKVKTKKNSGKSTSKSKNVRFTLGNRYYLKSVKFKSSASGAKPIVSSDKVGCSYYKPSIVSISDKNGIKVKKIKNGSKKTLDKVVKDAIKSSDSKVNVAINFDGYTKNGEVYNNVGWVNVVDLAVNRKKTNNEKINDLKQMKKLLNGASKDSGNKKVYKKI